MIIKLILLLALFWPWSNYWSPWYTVKGGYCAHSSYACYLDVTGDLWGENVQRIHVTYPVHRQAYPGRLCRFGNKWHDRYTRADCRF